MRITWTTAAWRVQSRCAELCVHFVGQTPSEQWGCSRATRPTWPARGSRPWRPAWARSPPSWAVGCSTPFWVRKALVLQWGVFLELGTYLKLHHRFSHDELFRLKITFLFSKRDGWSPPCFLSFGSLWSSYFGWFKYSWAVLSCDWQQADAGCRRGQVVFLWEADWL